MEITQNGRRVVSRGDMKRSVTLPGLEEETAETAATLGTRYQWLWQGTADEARKRETGNGKRTTENIRLSVANVLASAARGWLPYETQDPPFIPPLAGPM